MQDLLKLFVTGWSGGINGPSHILNAALTAQREMKYFCGFISLAMLQIPLPKQNEMWFQDHGEWKNEIDHCQRFGIIDLNNSIISISPFILYVWSLEASKIYDATKHKSRILCGIEKAMYNIGKYIQDMFNSVIISTIGEQDNIAFLIGLRLNCTKYLIQVGLMDPQSEYACLDSVFQYDINKTVHAQNENKNENDSKKPEIMQHNHQHQHKLNGKKKNTFY